MSEKEQSHVHESVDINSVTLRNLVQEYTRSHKFQKKIFCRNYDILLISLLLNDSFS